MVTIGQKAFNDELGRYLERVQKKGSKSFIDRISFSRGTLDEDVPELTENQTHIEYKEPSFFKRLLRWERKNKANAEELTPEEKQKLQSMEGEIEALEDEEEQLEALEEEVEEKKAGLISRFMSMINIFKKSPEEMEKELDEFSVEEVPSVDEDVKEVLRITYSWLEKLSDRNKKAFKESEDFLRYKNTLSKYGLIKEKAPEQK